jgi:predicted GIY-YIG superfamily endonuclease
MVYLIHFDEKFYHAQHYIGYSADKLFDKRIEHHKKGTGSSLMRAIMKAGIGWNVVRTWSNEDGNFERKLKNRKKASGICPICIANKLKQKYEQERII